MKPNVGTVDRIIRIIIGLIFFVLTLMGVIGWWGWIVGGIPLVTGLMGWCPPYAMLGISTCPVEQAPKS